jgi:hypothetical protein
MLFISRKTNNELVVELGRTKRDWIFSIAFFIFATLPFLFENSSTFELVLKIILFLVFAWTGVLSLGDVEIATFNKSKNTVRILRKNILNEKIYVHDLSELKTIQIETVKASETSSHYRIALQFNQSIQLPLTQTLFVDRQKLMPIAAEISSFLFDGENKDDQKATVEEVEDEEEDHPKKE